MLGAKAPPTGASMVSVFAEPKTKMTASLLLLPKMAPLPILEPVVAIVAVALARMPPEAFVSVR